MNETKKYYGLRLKGESKLLGYEIENADDEHSSSLVYTLSGNEDNEWLCDSYEQVRFVKYNLTPYYAASIYSPINQYPAKDLEIVLVEKVITIKLLEESPVKEVMLKMDLLKESSPGNKCFLIYSTPLLNEKESSMISLGYGQKKPIKLIVEEINEHAYKIIGGLNLLCPRYINKNDCEDIE